MRRERFYSVVQASIPLSGFGAEWKQELTGLWTYHDATGRKRAYISQSDFAGWFRAYVEGDGLPYDSLTLEGIKAIVEGVVSEQDRQTFEREKQAQASKALKAGK